MATLALNLLGASPGIIQGVTGLVHGIESLFGKGNGAAKKAAVQNAFNGSMEAYQAVAGAVPGLNPLQNNDQIQTALSSLIDSIVKFNNAMGVFKTATPAKP